MMDFIKEMTETKRRQLRLARKGLFRSILKSLQIHVPPKGMGEEEVNEKVNAALDEIIESSVAVYLLQKEVNEMDNRLENPKDPKDPMEKFFINVLKKAASKPDGGEGWQV